MTVTLVQSKVATGATASVTFDDAPAEGNLLLVAILSDAAIDDASAPTGWTFLSDASETGGVTGYGWLIGAERVAGAAESATADFSAAAPGNARLVAMEWHTTLAGWVNGGADTGDGGINGEAGATETERSAVGTGNLLVLAAACNGTTGWTPDGSSTELDEGQLAGPTPPDMSVTYQIADPVSAMTVTTTPGDPEQMASRVWTYLEMAPSGIYADWDGDGFGEPTQRRRPDRRHGIVASSPAAPARRSPAARSRAPRPSCSTTRPTTGTTRSTQPDRCTGSLRDGVPFWIGVNPDGSVTGTDPARPLRRAHQGHHAASRSAGGGRALAGGDHLRGRAGLAGPDAGHHLGQRCSASRATFRAAMLAAAGETRVGPAERDHDDAALVAGTARRSSPSRRINRANGSRHFIGPPTCRDDWYDYVVPQPAVAARRTVGRQHRRGRRIT